MSHSEQKTRFDLLHEHQVLVPPATLNVPLNWNWFSFLQECNLKHFANNHPETKLLKMSIGQGAFLSTYLVHLLMNTTTILESVYRITNIYSTETYRTKGKNKRYLVPFSLFFSPKLSRTITVLRIMLADTVRCD